MLTKIISFGFRHGKPPATVSTRWRIINKKTGDYWLNIDGWGNPQTAEIFSDDEKNVLKLPIGGTWQQYDKSEIKNVFVIDVRTIFKKNPYHNKALRSLRGTDLEVQKDIMKTPNFEALYEFLKAQVTVPGIEVVYLGCTGGHHRSVFLAERLSKELGVICEHRDIDK